MSADEPKEPKKENDTKDRDDGRAGTIAPDWWHTDGEKSWTDNNGSPNNYTVDNDHW